MIAKGTGARQNGKGRCGLLIEMKTAADLDMERSLHGALVQISRSSQT